MKRIIKKILKSKGYEISKITKETSVTDNYRPVGRMNFFLEDLKKRGLKCESILDVGANQGLWSRMAKEIYPEANFYLIEPQIEMEENLQNFCKEFNSSTYFLSGAGANPDKLIFTVDDDLAGSSFLPKKNDKLLKTGRQRIIDIITIDSLIEASKIKRPELIKLDIQGFELEALKGAKQTFGYTEAYILEVSLFPFSDVPGIPVFSEVVKFMLERNYVVYDFPGFLRRPNDGALGQCDICFVKKNSFLRKCNDWF